MVASEGKHEGESEGRLVVGAERDGEEESEWKRSREGERERRRERCLDEEAEVEVEEDNIDPLVVPPLLAQPTPSLYYPPSLRLRSDVCAHLRPLKTHGCPGHARVLSFLKRDLNEKGEKHRGESYVLHISRVLSSADSPLYVFLASTLRRPCFATPRLSVSESGAQGGALPWPRWIRGRSRKPCEDQRAREARHFIKNKFREGADGYPGASRGFHAADSRFLILSRHFSVSRASSFSHVRPSIYNSRRADLDCRAIVFPMSLYHSTENEFSLQLSTF